MVLSNSLYVDVVMTVLLLCVFIPLWVFIVLGWNIIESGVSHVDNESDAIEFMWTFGPSVSVLFLSILNTQCMVTGLIPKYSPIIKVTGHQWYWSYEQVGVEAEYDSVMVDFLDSVDKPMRLCLNEYCTLAVTSADVIHSFSVPEFNLKMDAIPGRINQVRFCPDRIGVFVGYCTELCGAGHGYMPVVVEVISKRFAKSPFAF